VKSSKAQSRAWDFSHQKTQVEPLLHKNQLTIIDEMVELHLLLQGGDRWQMSASLSLKMTQ